MADPGFPSWGPQSQMGVHQPLFIKAFGENYMKMKEFGPRGARPYRRQLGSATALTIKLPIFLTLYKWVENNSMVL